MLKKILAILIATITCMLFVACNKGDEPELPQYDFPQKENVVKDRQYYTGVDEIVFPNELWSSPVYERATQYDRQEYGAQSYFLQSVDFDSKATHVFAFVGIPEGATKDNPVPGVVLVHGGGGTAFPDWVKMWNDKGYAAIAIDTEGRIPSADASLNNSNNVSFESTKHHGPSNTSYQDGDKPADQQYLYHAIASAIVANSFLASFEQVDENKIGLTGISWGGVIATNVAAYDDRFAFAVPVYGAVAMTGTTGLFGTLYNNYPRCSLLWDNVEMLKNCRTPMLFVNWEGDPFFSIDATKKCADTAIYADMVLIPNLQHGHLQGANIKEIFHFANCVLDIE